jgi:hypothetical protein
MNKEELAKILNGREIGKEITRDEESEAEKNGLVVVFGGSDDLMEFHGFIDDEIPAYGGITQLITAKGLLENDCDSDDCPYFKEIKKTVQSSIQAIWDAEGYSWVYKTDIPHSQFDIMENGEKFCRGIVFDLADLTGKENL